MARRFLAGLEVSSACREMLGLRIQSSGWTVALDTREIFVAVPPETPTLALGNEGIVIGGLFARNARVPVRELRPETASAIVRTGGQHLVDTFWGDYIALWGSDGGIAVLRGPFGNLPCLYASLERGVLAGADVASLRHAGLRPLAIDTDALAHHLIAPDIRRTATCLEGIRELRGGDRMTVAEKGTGRVSLWSPWTFASPERRCDEEAQACEELRRLVDDCIGARTAAMAKPLVMLSGGLDSSIVAASLAYQGRDFDCLTFATPDRIGDEREQARAVAAHLDRSIVESAMIPDGIDIAGLAAIDLPRPTARSFEQHVHGVARDIARARGCDGVIDGGGGDNVFCSLQSAAAAADCLLSPAGRRHFWRVCGDVGELVRASRFKVAWHALRRAGSPHRAPRWSLDLRFLTSPAQSLGPQATGHPWLCENPTGLPGRGVHVALLVAAQGYIEDGPFGTKGGSVPPLLSQPLIEHCLAIPSWQWLARGNNRAAARKAFETRLPERIAWRQGKGAPDSFVIALLDRNRAQIRERLSDGFLARNDIIDRDLVLRSIDDPRPAHGTDYRRLMRLFDTECWAASIEG